jgi:hypothetical protein
VTENLGALGWEISGADMTKIDTILARHGVVTVPPGWLEDSPSSEEEHHARSTLRSDDQGIRDV